ncbi:MAG: glycosyltransferase [Bacteroidota bacterium]
MKYFLLVASNGIGGAETRALKLLSYLSQNTTLDCCLILNQSLLDSYQENKFTKYLISNDKIEIKVVDKDRPNFIKDHKFNVLLKDKRLYKFIKLIPGFILKRISWYKFMLKHIPNEEDVKIHCIHGETPRIGTLYWAKHNKGRVNIEITSNRHVFEWGIQFKKVLRANDDLKNFHTTCVSQTVFNNFSKALNSYGVDTEAISLDYYQGPFLFFPKMYDNAEKENIIVFAHRLINTKNPILFAEVVKELYDEGVLKNWNVYFRGDGALKEDISNILTEEIESKKIEIGYTTDLQADLRKSKLFISLVITGNFPSNSVFEAMNYNNILLLSDTGITKEKFDFPEVNLCQLEHNSLKETLLKAIEISENEEAFKKDSLATNAYYNYLVEKGEYLAKLNSILNF